MSPEIIISYHGTKKLESILASGALCCNASFKFKSYELADKEARELALKTYNEMTLAMALKAREHGLQNKAKFGTDEELADIAEDYSKGNSMWYKELKRNYFVWLGAYDRTLSWIQSNGHILEFKIPIENVRKGQMSTDILVWWKLELDYSTRIFTSEDNLNETLELLEKYKIKNVEIKKFTEFT